MIPTDQRAWRHWRRVEACVGFGLGQWLWTALAFWVAWKYLEPISELLLFLAIAVILFAHNTYSKRLDAKHQEPDGRASL